VCSRWNDLSKTEFLWKRWCLKYGWESPYDTDGADDPDDADAWDDWVERSVSEEGPSGTPARRKPSEETQETRVDWRKIVQARYPKWRWFNGFAEEGFAELLASSRSASSKYLSESPTLWRRRTDWS